MLPGGQSAKGQWATQKAYLIKRGHIFDRSTARLEVVPIPKTLGLLCSAAFESVFVF